MNVPHSIEWYPFGTKSLHPDPSPPEPCRTRGTGRQLPSLARLNRLTALACLRETNAERRIGPFQNGEPSSGPSDFTGDAIGVSLGRGVGVEFELITGPTGIRFGPVDGCDGSGAGCILIGAGGTAVIGGGNGCGGGICG